MQPAPQCPSQFNVPPIEVRQPKRKRSNWALYNKALEPLTALHGTPDDHYDEWANHRPHTAAWEAAEAEVQRRLIAYWQLERF